MRYIYIYIILYNYIDFYIDFYIDLLLEGFGPHEERDPQGLHLTLRKEAAQVGLRFRTPESHRLPIRKFVVRWSEETCLEDGLEDSEV